MNHTATQEPSATAELGKTAWDMTSEYGKGILSESLSDITVPKILLTVAIVGFIILQANSEERGALYWVAVAILALTVLAAVNMIL